MDRFLLPHFFFRCALLAGTYWLVTVPTHARAAVRLDITTVLPCSRDELANAVAARLPLDGPDATVVAVEAVGADAIRIVLGLKARVVPLTGLQGTAAARRIALAVVDLATAEAHPPAAPPVAEAQPEPPRVFLVVLPAVGVGSNLASVWLAGSVGGSLRLRHWLRATLDVGYGGGPNGSVDGIDVTLQYLPLRMALAAAPRQFPMEARLGVLAAPYWVRGGAKMSVRTSGALAAIDAATLFFVPRRGRVRAVLGAGVDLFLNREQFLIHGTPVLASERVGFWAGCGLAVTLSP